MALKLKKVTEKKIVKKDESDVKSNLMTIQSQKSLHQIANYEIVSMLSRLRFLAEEHNLIPVIKNIELIFEPITGGSNGTTVCKDMELGQQQERGTISN
jgi:hypothetical protein